MIDLVKYTYMMAPEKIQKELDNLWKRYQDIINTENPTWEETNEARAILYLTGQIYCEKIAIGAIERRLHLLKEKLTPLEFFNLIDKNSNQLDELRKDELFTTLEKFYNIIKKYKNKNLGGKYYLDEEKFIKKHNQTNPNQELSMDYRGSFEHQNTTR